MQIKCVYIIHRNTHIHIYAIYTQIYTYICACVYICVYLYMYIPSGMKGNI